MKWVEVKIYFDSEDKRLASDLISDIFYDCGLRGVVVEEPDDVSSKDWGKDAIQPEHYAVIGYFQKNETFKNHLKTVEKRIKRLEKENAFQCRMDCSEINEADWAESWKDYFWPQKIGDRLIVKPAWREYVEKDDDVVIDIDPGMAFGTGTHSTTRLCIALIEKYMKIGDSFLDVGTGSGILMIAAAKFGARKIYGTDHDTVALDIARKNLLLNMIPEKNAKVVNCHLANEVTGRFNVVAANVSKEPVLIFLEDAARLLNDNGVLIFSGITEDDKAVIDKKIGRSGFDIIETVLKEDWVAVACRLKR